MKRKTQVLFSSLLAIGMSASLAVGGTYALFTSEDSVNISVSSGTVKVEASIDKNTLKLYSFDEVQTGTFENNGTATFTNENKDLALNNVTPGDKAEFTIVTENSSNVDILYRVVMSATGELVPALTATATINGVEYDVAGSGKATAWLALDANAAIGNITVAVEFPENGDDDNDYQGKSANVAFTVEAVQGNAPVAKFASILAQGGTVELEEDFVLSESIYIPEGVTATLDLNGHDIIATNDQTAGAVIENAGTLIIQGDGVSEIANNTLNGASVILNKGDLTLNNVVIKGAQNDTSGTASYAVNTQGAGSTLTVNDSSISGRGAIGATKGAKVVVSGGTYHTPYANWGHAIYASGAGTEVTFNNGTVTEGYDYANDLWGMYQIYAGDGSKVVVNDGDFSQAWDCANGYDLATSGTGVIEIRGGTFADNPSNQYGKNFVAAGYEVVENADGTFTVVQSTNP